MEVVNVKLHETSIKEADCTDRGECGERKRRLHRAHSDTEYIYIYNNSEMDHKKKKKIERERDR